MRKKLAAVALGLAVAGGTAAVVGGPVVAGALEGAAPAGVLGFRGDHGPGAGKGLGVAATALGVPEADLRTALEGGKSIADVAKEKGVDLQKVIDALVAAETARIDADLEADLEAGRITQALADQRRASVAARVAAQVEVTGWPGHGGRGGHGRGGHGFKADLTAVAPLLELSEADLRTQLQAGKSLADIATARGVDQQKVVDALVAAETKRIDGAVTTGRLTAEEATAAKAGLAGRITKLVTSAPSVGRPDGKGGPGHRGRGGPGVGVGVRGEQATVVASALTMSEADLRTALEGGKTVAELAKERGVDPKRVVDALVAAETKRIDDAVTAGKVTAEQANTAKAGLPARAQAVVDGTKPAGGPGFGRGKGGQGGQGAKPSAGTQPASAVIS